MLSMWRSSLNLSNTVPLAFSRNSGCPPFWTIPQHSITSGCIWLTLERQGLPNVMQGKVWPWSKLADRNKPKWFTRPPNPSPLGMLSELKFTAHYQCNKFQNINRMRLIKHSRNIMQGIQAEYVSPRTILMPSNKITIKSTEFCANRIYVKLSRSPFVIITKDSEL